MHPQAIDTLEKGMDFCGNERAVFAFGCFQLLLSNGAVGGFFPRKLMLSDYLVNSDARQVDCVKRLMATESHHLGCIASVSVNAFRTYHDTLAVLTADLQSRPRPPCTDALMLTWGPKPDVSGFGLLNAAAFEHATNRTPVLAQWCNQFAPIDSLHLQLVQQRFRCCVSASGWFFIKKALIELFDPRLVEVHCNDLVTSKWSRFPDFQRRLQSDCLRSSLMYPGGSKDKLGFDTCLSVTTWL